MYARGLPIRLLSSTFVWWFVSSSLPAQSLRYQWEPKQKFSYEMTITVDEDERITTLKGTVHYTVDSVEEDQRRLIYRGGLVESSKTKPQQQSGFPVGPIFGPRGFPGLHMSPFSRPTFTGKVQSTNYITLSPTGRVLAMKGDSQLPYLLGNASLLPFEMLPKADEREWVVDEGTSITEEGDFNRRPFGPFGAFGPFASADKRNVQSATEITRYTIDGEDDELVKLKKSYELKTPVTGDSEAFEMTGSGVWVFNAKDHVPESLDMNYQLMVKDGNTSTTFPISVKFTRISDAELAKMEAEAQRLRDEKQRQMAADKARAEAPLTEDEKDRALSVLGGNDVAATRQLLKELATKSLADPDPEIAAAIQRLLTHTDSPLVEAASKALVKWSPSYKAIMDLKKAYEGPSPVKSTDLEVNSTTDLYVGQIVQVQEHGSFWFPARINALLGDGRVEVGFLAWGKANRSSTLARRNLQLAPDGVEQPARPSLQESFVPAALRTWTDATGRFKVEAEFLGSADGLVRLQRSDGREVELPLDKLSAGDQVVVKQLLEELANAENPFEPKPKGSNPFEPTASRLGK